MLKKKEEKLDLSPPSISLKNILEDHGGVIVLVFDDVVVSSVQVHAEQKGSLQPIDSQRSDTNPQQPNSCHPTLLHLPHSLPHKTTGVSPSLPICRRARPGLVSGGTDQIEITHVNTVVGDFRYEDILLASSQPVHCFVFTVELFPHNPLRESKLCCFATRGNK